MFHYNYYTIHNGNFLVATTPGAGRKAENRTVNQGELIYGSGCEKCPSCFSCPLPDCTWNSAKFYKHRNNT